GAGFCLEPRDLTAGHLERTVQRRHKGPPHDLEYTETFSARCFHHDAAPPRHAVWIIRRSQQTRLLREEVEDLLLVPGVVAGRDDREPHLIQFMGQLRRDSETPRHVFPVPDHQIHARTEEHTSEIQSLAY